MNHLSVFLLKQRALLEPFIDKYLVTFLLKLYRYDFKFYTHDYYLMATK